MKQKLFFILTLYTTLAFAQQEASIWYFGSRAGLDFNSGSPVVLSDGQLDTYEGCATISDKTGKLLFYTDGITVYNKNHLKMPNGIGLNGNSSSTQSAIIVPKPNSTTLYYIFTVDFEGGVNGLQYSIVDITLNSGLGDVTSTKNVLLRTPVCEKLTAVKNVDGNGYWVVAHGYGNSSFLAYSITSSGLNPIPVVSNVGSFIFSDDSTKAVGYLKFSPDGSKLISCNSSINVELFNFDALTGIVSNPRLVCNRIFTYGVEFSPSGKIAYISMGDEYGQMGVDNGRTLNLMQYDLTVTNIPSTETLIYKGFNAKYQMGSLQLAIDGKIYVSNLGIESVSSINNPDVLGKGCNFKFGIINLGTGISYFGLPQFIQSYFNASFTAQNLCFGSNTEFKLTATSTPTSILWDFGDGETSTVINPNHQYAIPGKYNVSVDITSVSGKTNKSREIVISPTPIIANPIPNQSDCGAASMNYDLSQHNATLLGSQSSSIFGVGYFSSQDDANKHSNPLPNAFALPLGVTTIYAKVYNLLNTSCNVITSFTITLNKQPIANALTDYVICENLPYDNIDQFDLAIKNTSVLKSQNPSEFAISYHTNQLNAVENKTPLSLLYTNTLVEETLYVRVENKTNPKCFATTTLNLKVVQEPKLTAVTNFVLCDNASNDGIANFDLTQKTNQILNGQSASAFEVKYYYSQNNAQDNTDEIKSPINNTTNNQDIYYSISAIGNSNCKVISSFKLVVTSLPTANTVNPIFICDDVTNDGLGTINLQNNNSALLGTQSSDQLAVSYYENQSDADSKSNPLPLNYQNTSNPQTIFARVENKENSSCFATTSFQIGLYKMPTANPVQNLITCDDDSNDGKEIFDLTTQNSTILGSQSQSDFTISYHQSLADANSGTNEVTSNYTNTTNPQTIYARIVNTLSAACYATTSFQLIIKKKPELDLKEEYSICEGKSISITAPSGFTSYLWSNENKTPKTTIKQAGTYSLTVTKNYGDITCETTKAIVVTNSNIATITKIDTQDWTTSENTITIYATGDGDYEYSIDGVNYQDSPQFFGLNNGQYKVYVKDKRGCGIKTDEVFLLMYPKFFTPNGDGTNDTWHIKYSDNEPKMKLIIYDRYGKMITSYNGLKVGWDGRYNGQLLPSDDYWFVVLRENGKEYKGHFTMKR